MLSLLCINPHIHSPERPAKLIKTLSEINLSRKITLRLSRCVVQISEQSAEKLRDGYTEYFSLYDELITRALPIPANKYGVGRFVIDEQEIDAPYLQSATVPLNVTGLPDIALPLDKVAKDCRLTFR